MPRIRLRQQDMTNYMAEVTILIKIKNILPKKAFFKEQKNKFRSLKNIKNILRALHLMVTKVSDYGYQK